MTASHSDGASEGDTALSCSGLISEIKEAKKFKEDARDEKDMTGTNVAAGLFFWPALLVSYNNIGEAVDAAEDRIDNLMDIGKDKDCKGF
jgi:hypothetical protein